MDRLLTDLRYAFRLLRRSPGFTAAAVTVLALGIGASTAVFSVVDNILFRPLDLPAAERLVTICEMHESLRDACVAATPNVVDWADRTRAFESLGAGRSRPFNYRTDDGGRPVNAGIAMPGFLRTLGFSPVRGRLFEATDGAPLGPGRVVVLTHAFWQDEFGSDPEVLGQSLVFDEQPYTVIGILPEKAVAPRLDYVRVWLPLPWDPATESNRDWRGFFTVGRLSPGSSIREAESELEVVQASLALTYPDVVEGWGVQVRPLRDHLVGNVRPTLLIFLAAVAVVLLIVCVNMAGLLMARASVRQRELAVRSALGGKASRLVGQLLTESTLLAVLGGAGGVLVAMWGTQALVSLAPPGIPRIDEVVVDARILGFAFGTALIVGLAFGLVPALSIRRLELSDVLRDGRSRAATQAASRLRRSLVVTELALAVVLMAGSGVLLRSFAGLLDWRPGFDTEQLLTFQLFPSIGKYPERTDVLALYKEAERVVDALPGVASVGTASAGPLFGGGDGASPFLIEGRSDWTPQDAPSVLWFDVGPTYFQTLGIPLHTGRMLSEDDDGSRAPVALINEAMADRYWSGDSPIGARVAIPELSITVEVVGVVGDVTPFFPDQPTEPELYFSNRQRTRWASYFVLRTDTDPGLLAGPATEALQRVDSDLAPRMRTMNEHIGTRLVRPKFNVLLIGLFAAIALILGLAGVYGVVAYSVQLRTREIGIRMALGAERARVLRWVMGEGLVLVGVGVVVGVVGALAFTRLLSGMLYGVSASDPLAFAGTAAILFLTGLAACLAPAIRASRVDPLEALRQE